MGYSKSDYNLLKSLETIYVSNSTLSLADHIKNKFIHAHWNGIYRRDSWLGRLAVWLQYPSERKQAHIKACRIFANCLQGLPQNQLVDFRYDFVLRAQEELASFMDPPLLNEFTENEELAQFDQFIHNREIEYTATITRNSYLETHVPIQTLSFEQFKGIFSRDNRYFSQTFALLKEYLKSNPAAGISDWKEKLNLMKSGHQAAQSIKEKVKSLGRKFSAKKSHQAAWELAAIFVEKIGALAPGKSFQLNCYYGTPNLTIETFFSFLRSLPNILKKNASSDFIKLTTMDTVDLTEAFLQEFAKEIENSIMPSQYSMVEKVKKFSFLFPHHSRELQHSEFLPQVVAEFLENLLKEGLLKDAALLFNSETVRKLLSWLAANGRKIHEEEGIQAFLLEFETKFKEIGTSRLLEATSALDNKIDQLRQFLRKYVPAFVLNTLGLESLTQQGPIWYKIERSKKGDRVSFEIMTVGTNLAMHKIPQTELVSPILRIDNIPLNSLDAAFMQRVIFQYLSSLNNLETPKVGDLYAGLFNELPGRKSYPLPQKNLDDSRSSEIELALNILFRANPREIYQFRLQMFLDFCAPLFTGEKKELQTTDPEILDSLAAAVEELEIDARKIFKDHETALNHISATKQEITMKVMEAKKKNLSEEIQEDLLLPPQIIKPIQSFLSRFYISKETIESIKNKLISLLGDDFGDIIDLIVSSLGSFLPEKNTSQKNSGKINSKSFLKLYGSLTAKIFMAALMASGLWHVGFSHFFMITLVLPSARLFLPYFLPPPLTSWYFRLEQAIIRTLSQLIVKVIIHYGKDSRPVKVVQNYFHEIEARFNQIKEKLSGNYKITYVVPHKETVSKKMVSVLETTMQSRFEKSPVKQKILVSKDFSTPFSSKQIIEELKELINRLRDDKNAVAQFAYLLNKISLLPMPGKSNFWNKVENAEQTIALIASLGIALNDCFLRGSLKNSSLRYHLHAEIVAASYHLLAIADCLARRSLDPLPAKTNAYPLLIWLQKNGNLVKNCRTASRFKAICDYFFPEIDLNHLPNESELAEAAKKTLFNHHLYKKGLPQLSRAFFLSYKMPELRYLDSILKNPSNKSQMKKQGWKKEDDRPLLINALLQESLDLTQTRSPLIPDPYRYLKQTTLIATQSTHFEIQRGVFVNHKRYYSCYDSRFYHSLGYFSPSSHTSMPDYLSNGYKLPLPRPNYAKDILAQIPASQSKILENIVVSENLERQAANLNLNFQELQQLFLVMAEPKDQVLRAMEWFKKRKDVFAETNNFATEILYICFFQFGSIERQLKDSPSSTLMIGEFIDDLFRFHLGQKNISACLRIIFFALKIKQFVQDLAPEYAKDFPDLFSLLKDLNELSNHSSNPSKDLPAIYMLQALAHGDWEDLNLNSKTQAATFLCLGIIAIKGECYKNLSPFHGYNELIFDFLIYYNLLIEEVIALPTFQECLNCVHHGQYRHHTSTQEFVWFPVCSNPYAFQNNLGTQINLADGTYENKRDPLWKADQKIHQLIKLYQLPPLKFQKEEGEYKSEDGLYSIKIDCDQDRFLFAIYRTIDGIKYQLSSDQTFNKSIASKEFLLLTRFKYAKEESLIFWKEFRPKDRNLIKVIVHTQDDVQDLEYFGINHYLQADYQTNVVYFSGPNQEKPLIKFNENLFDGLLQPLYSFCPSDQVNCLGDPQTGQIVYINLADILRFEVKNNSEGKLAAFCLNEELAGYSISQKQTHPLLKNFQSYLALENGDKKIVLLKKDSLAHAPAWKFCNHFGELGRFAFRRFSEFFSNKGYLVYELDRNGALIGKNPLEAANLTAIYVMQQDHRQAFEQLKKLEKILNSQPVENQSEILNEIAPIILIPPGKNVSYLRLRLIAALERNKQIQRQASQPQNQTSVKLERFIVNLVIYFDYPYYLKNDHPYQKLSLGHEYFILQFFFNSFRSLTPDSANFEDLFLQDLTEESLIPFAENFFMPAEVKERWDFLRKKWGLRISLSHQFHKLLKKMQTSILPLDRLGRISVLTSVAQKSLSIAKKLDHYFPEQILNKLPRWMLKSLKMPPLKPEEFNPESLKIYFASYYSIAIREYLIGGKEEREQLGRLLKINKGGWNKESQVLVEILEIAYYSTFNPPSSRALLAAAAKSADPQIDNFRNQIENYEQQIIENKAYLEALDRRIAKSARLKLAEGEKGKEKAKNRPVDMTGMLIQKEELRALLNDLQRKKKIIEAKINKLLQRESKAVDQKWQNFIHKLSIFLRLKSTANQVLNDVRKKAIGNYKGDSEAHRSDKWMKLTSYLPQGENFKAIATFAASVAPGAKREALQKRASAAVDERERIERFLENAIRYKPPSYAQIKETEDSINEILQELFDLVYEEFETDLPECVVKPFEFSNENNYFRRGRFELVNESLRSFNEQRSNTRLGLRVFNIHALKTVYSRLATLQIQWSSQLAQDKKRVIVAYAELLKHREFLDEITFNDIWHFIENYNGLNPDEPSVEQIQSLEIAIARTEHLQSRLNQIEGILKEMRAIEKLLDRPSQELIDEDKSLINEKLELIADGLLAKTAFDFETTSNKQAITYLRYQSRSAKMIWPRQAKRLELQMHPNHTKSVNQQPCGDGKTEVLTPNMIEMEADGSKLVLAIAPKAVSGTLYTIVSGLLHHIFNRTSHRHRHARNIPLDKHALEALFVTLESARANKEIIFITREDLEALYGIFIDQLHHYVHSKKKSKDEKKCLITLQKIFALIYDYGCGIVDEAHEVYNQRKKTNLPVGTPQTIKESYFNTIKLCMRLLLEHPGMQKAIEENKIYNIPKNVYRKEIIPSIAKKLIEAFNIKSKTKKKEFIRFFKNKIESIPPWLVNHPRYQEICLAKGVLTVLVDQNRKMKIRSNVDYGTSKTKNDEFARPYAGNSHPIEESTIQDPFETIVKTFLLILGNGLTKPQTIKFIQNLKQKMLVEIDRRHVPCTETTVWNLLDNQELQDFIFRTDTIKDESEEWDQVVLLVNKNPHFLFEYIKTFIWKQIQYWDYSIQVDSQKFSSLLNSHRAGTATPYNDAYPPSFTMLRDIETIGESLHTIQVNNPDKILNIIRNNEIGIHLTPLEILHKMFDQFLADPLCTLFIDGGALFTGLESEFIAREMLRYAKKHRTDVEAIDFFKKDDQDIYQIFLLTDPDGVPFLEEEGNFDYKKRISFIDHSHGVAANLKQRSPGYAVVTIGPLHPLYRMIQESYRELRDPKKDRRMQSIFEDYAANQAQMVRFATTEEVASLMGYQDLSEPIRTDQLFEYGIRSESKIVSNDNKESIGPKLKAVPHGIIFGKMVHADFKGLLAFYKRFEYSLFLNKLLVDPAELWGNIPRKIPADEAIATYRHAVSKNFENTEVLTPEEEEAIKTEINDLPMPPLPEKLKVYDKGHGEIEVGILDQIGQQLEVFQETKIEQTIHLEQTNHIESQKQKYIYREIPWPKFSLKSLDWLVISDPLNKTDPKKARNFLDFKDSLSISHYFKRDQRFLFSIRETLAAAKVESLASISEYFDEALWYPNNWLPRRNDADFAAPAEICSKNQRDLYEMIIHFEESEGELKILKAAPLSLYDAAIWREKMGKAKEADPEFWQKQKIKVILWDVYSQGIAAGYQPQNLDGFRNNARLLKFVAMMKFLNGDVSYGPYYKALIDWLDQIPEKNAMFEAFRIIHFERGTEPFIGSDLDYVFSKIVENSIF